MAVDELLATLVEECHDDYVGFWRLVRAARCDLGARDAAEIRTTVLTVTGRLLHEPGLCVGQFAPDRRTFVPWQMPAEQALARIESEWNALGREPDIGEIAWFTCAPTPAG